MQYLEKSASRGNFLGVVIKRGSEQRRSAGDCTRGALATANAVLFDITWQVNNERGQSD